MSFIWETPEEMNMAIAQRLRGIRKWKNLPQPGEKELLAVGKKAGTPVRLCRQIAEEIHDKTKY